MQSVSNKIHLQFGLQNKEKMVLKEIQRKYKNLDQPGKNNCRSRSALPFIRGNSKMSIKVYNVSV